MSKPKFALIILLMSLVLVTSRARNTGLLPAVQAKSSVPEYSSSLESLQEASSFPPAIGAYKTGEYRNLFKECDLENIFIDADTKLQGAWDQLFYGNQDQFVYYPVGNDMAYVWTVDSNDVRTEGMSYGMMIAVQLDKKEEFDRLWRWATTYMQHKSGARKDYFAWKVSTDHITIIDPNPASDGEEWFTMALFFASARWGDKGEFDYRADAQTILDTMLDKEDDPLHGDMTNMFNKTKKQVVFVPYDPPNPNNRAPASFTDPSYHLPAFYELWADWADKDRDFWETAATTSRQFFEDAAHPKTGLMPDYAEWGGTPVDPWNEGHDDFRFDAWRVAMNVAVDYAWFAADDREKEQSDRLLNFFDGKNDYGNMYELDGTRLSTPPDDHSPGLVAMNAVAGLASTDKTKICRFVRELWSTPVPTGTYRYYDGMLYMLALLHLSGNFRIYDPTGGSDKVDVALIIDSSSSMGTNDPNDLRKEAAKIFIDAMQDQDQVAVIDFDDGTNVPHSLQPVYSDRSGPKAAVDTIDSSGLTDIGAGLQVGFNELSLSTRVNQKAAVLLTDGVGGYSGQATQYASKGWRVFTIGLGNQTDEILLRRVADETGGRYYALSDPGQLQSVYFDINTQVSGATTILDKVINLVLGATKKILVSIPDGQKAVNILVNWPGSTVDTKLIDPDGRIITPEVAVQALDIYHAKGTTYELYRVTNPEPGNWEIEIYGADIPIGGEDVTVKVSARGTKTVYLPLILKNFDGSHPPPTPAPNNPPNIPAAPSPSNGAGNQSLNTILRWSGGDPDGDSVTYDVYVEANDNSPDVLGCNDTTNTLCNPGPLDYETDYYWQVIARDSRGKTRSGPVWHFTTTSATYGWQEIGAGSASAGGISNNSGDSERVSTAMAADGNLYAAWDDDSSGARQIYVRRWNGSDWQEVGTGSASAGGISQSSAGAFNASLAIGADGRPYVAWHAVTTADREIYIRRWNGSAWQEVGTGSASAGGISNNSGQSREPTLTFGADGQPYVAWQDNSDGDWEIYVRRWNGSSWQEVGTGSASAGGISNNSGDSERVSTAMATDGSLYVAWDDDSSGVRQIYMRRWNGATWLDVGAGSASGGGISQSSEGAFNAAVAIGPDGRPYVAWHAVTTADREIYIRRWNGNAWQEVGTGSASAGGISNNNGQSREPSLVFGADGQLYVTWHDDSSGDWEIYVRRWNGSAWQEVGTGSASGGGISNNSGSSQIASTTLAPAGSVSVTWQDDSSGDYEIYTRRWGEINLNSADQTDIADEAIEIPADWQQIYLPLVLK